MLDGDAESGGRPRRVRTVSVRLAAGGATARSISPSLARVGATPKWPGVYLRSGRRPPSSSVRVADLRTSRHVRPSVAEVSELFFDGCDGSGSSVRTPAVISLRAVCWGDARAPPRLAWPRRTAIFPRREAKLPVSSRDVAAGRAAAHVKIRAARLGLAADGNACDAHGWHGRAEKPLGRATAEAPLVRCVFVF